MSIDVSLSTDQENLITHWIDGRADVTADMAPGIRAAYKELVREFLAWRAAFVQEGS